MFANDASKKSQLVGFHSHYISPDSIKESPVHYSEIFDVPILSQVYKDVHDRGSNPVQTAISTAEAILEMAALPENNSEYRSDRAEIVNLVSDYRKAKIIDDQCLRTDDVNCWGEPEELPQPLFHSSIT